VRLRRGAAALAAVVGAFSMSTAAAAARQVIVDSFDGTPIVAHFCPAAGLREGHRAPTIMIGPGWGSPGDRCSGSGLNGAGSAPFGIVGTSTFIEAGYNVVTWDPRGFWSSGGAAQIDSPDYEGRDAQALIDFVARQPEARLDRPGDPLLGMYGGSYGGGIQLVTAGLDDRVDAIVPTIAWNSLVSALYPDGEVKSGWGAILAGIGVPTTTLPGIVSPAGIELGNQSPQFYDMLTHGLAFGSFPADDVAWLADHGPDRLLRDIHVPTLLVQGEQDTLFDLDEAHRNYRALRRGGTKVKMIWFCGGHGICLTPRGGQGDVIKRSALAWFARYLRGRDVHTGPPFRWLDDAGEWHRSRAYPLSRSGSLVGRGSGTLPIVPILPDAGSGIMIAATPTPASVRVTIPGPSHDADVVGPPKLRATYRGRALPARTFVYAQIVDPRNHLVVNNQVEPVPLRLDGHEHTVRVPLVRIASHADAGTGYRLQIAAGSSVYDFQRSAGKVHFSKIRVKLPLAEPAG
jgi:ABC-2 type transport system ATP-binding protein